MDHQGRVAGLATRWMSVVGLEAAGVCLQGTRFAAKSFVEWAMSRASHASHKLCV
jgi:hypothetical protein